MWSDGSAQDVGTGLVSDEDALNVTTLTSSLKLMPPSNSEKMWRARVATGAEAECGDLLAVELSMCGTPVPEGTTLVPVCSTLAPSRAWGSACKKSHKQSRSAHRLRANTRGHSRAQKISRIGNHLSHSMSACPQEPALEYTHSLQTYPRTHTLKHINTCTRDA